LNHTTDQSIQDASLTLTENGFPKIRIFISWIRKQWNSF